MQILGYFFMKKMKNRIHTGFTEPKKPRKTGKKPTKYKKSLANLTNIKNSWVFISRRQSMYNTTYNMKWIIRFISQKLEFETGVVRTKKYALIDEIIPDNIHNRFPQSVMVDFLNDHRTKLDDFSIGDKVDVTFTIKYSKFSKHGRVYNNIKWIKITHLT